MPTTAYAEFVFDVFKLALYIACAYVALSTCTPYSNRLVAISRFAVLGLLALLVIRNPALG
jgi:hypothetical protein